MVNVASLARRGNRRTRVLVLATGLLILAAIAVPALALHKPAPTTVTAVDFDFIVPVEDEMNTNTVTIKQGTNVLLENIGPIAPHTLSSIGAFESGALLPGGQRIVVTEHLAPGTYEFFCGFHPDSMQGTLIVES